MRYCPNCQRINVGHPPICNYCGRTWYVRLCPSRHENPYNAQYCSTCGSTDLSETVGVKPWWSLLCRVPVWIIAILFVVGITEDADHVLPMILSLSLPVAILLFVYSLIVSLAPGPVKGLIRSFNKTLINLTSNFFVGVWNLIKWILFDNRNSRGT